MLNKDDVMTVACAILAIETYDMPVSLIQDWAEVIVSNLEAGRRNREYFEKHGHYGGLRGSVLSDKEFKLRNKGKEIVGISPMMGPDPKWLELRALIEKSYTEPKEE